MRSPEMTGEAWPKPGSGVCQLTFLPVLTFQFRGSGLVASTPEAFGPRNCGHSAALIAGMSAARMAIVRKYFGIKSFFLQQPLHRTLQVLTRSIKANHRKGQKHP